MVAECLSHVRGTHVRETQGRRASRLCSTPGATDHIQRVLSIGSEQHMRQQFCDKLFQQDLEAILSSSHLQIEPRRPLDSISSMEVNVDFLELTDHMDMFEQEALDIFLSSGGDESDQPSPLAGELWFPCTYYGVPNNPLGECTCTHPAYKPIPPDISDVSAISLTNKIKGTTEYIQCVKINKKKNKA
uniref:Uncharacterized protein n=1 Tax=Paramormyrops kingsleyae TaxID=1676925 RepID=A0A3B3QYT9_9TELE